MFIRSKLVDYLKWNVYSHGKVDWKKIWEVFLFRTADCNSSVLEMINVMDLQKGLNIVIKFASILIWDTTKYKLNNIKTALLTKENLFKRL